VARYDELPPATTASMQRDIVAGRPSELEEQTGALVRLASGAAVSVPAHELLLAILKPQETAARDPGSR
jgi:2-dehydropantoate 2-reductase